MLRRVNGGLFEAPAGARIQLVAQAQGNNGVEDARFQYGTGVLTPERINGLPGCTFDVFAANDLLEVGVVFDPAAPGTARYDVFEIENGVKSALGLSVRHSAASPLIMFTIAPLAVPAAAGAAPTRSGPPRAETAAPVRKARPKKAAKKRAKKAAAKASKKRPKKAAAKKAARKKSSRKTSRKRTR